MKYNEYYSSDMLKGISISFGKFGLPDQSKKTGKVVLSFQFYCPHWLTLVNHNPGLSYDTAYIYSNYYTTESSTPIRTFYMEYKKTNRYSQADITETGTEGEILHGIMSFCEQAELFTKNFYFEKKNDDDTITYCSAGIGKDIELAGYNVHFVSYTSLSKDIKDWINDVSLGDKKSSSSSTSVIHGSFNQTDRPPDLMSKLAALGVKFSKSNGVVPEGFNIPSYLDDPKYLDRTCNYFYRFFMPAVATIPANYSELSKITKDMQKLFAPFIANTAGFKLVFNANFFKDEEVS